MNKEQTRIQEIRARYCESERAYFCASPRTWKDINYLLGLVESLQRDQKQCPACAEREEKNAAYIKMVMHEPMPENQPKLGVMPIKNYTSNVDSFASLGEIKGALARGGADKVMVEYANRKPIGVKFSLKTPIGERTFALLANVDGVLAVFKEQRVKADLAQAERTAWRNIRDWVMAQMAFIEAGQVKMDQVFFPYLTDGRKTIYQAYQEGKVLLPEGKV